MEQTEKGNVLIKDALYNLHIASGSTIEYAKGVLVGVVSGLMAQGLTFMEVANIVGPLLPVDYRRECIPAPWKGVAFGG